MGKRDEIKAGIVIGVSLLVLAGLTVAVSGISLWERYDRYTVRLRSSGGLEEGAPVRLGGLRVGRVLGVRIPAEDTAKVEVTLGVRQAIAIPQGTWATVSTLGLLGDTYLQLSTETHNAQRIPPGSEIPGRDSAQIAELVQRLQGVAESTDLLLGEASAMLKADIKRLLQQVSTIADTTQATLTRIDAFVAPANRQRIEKIVVRVDQILQESGDSVQKLLQSLTAASRRMDATVAALQGVVGENRSDIRDAVKLLKDDLDRAGKLAGSLEKTLAGVDRTLDRVDRTVLDNRDTLEETLANLRRTSRNLRELSQSVKERPSSVLFPPQMPEKPGLESRR